ncbi:tektin-3-like [Lissotriton helveticus]
MQDKDQLTRAMQADCRRNIDHRLTDIHYWYSELCQELEQLMAENCRLKCALERLQKALAETTEAPQQIAQECLFHREKRMGLDLVHDTVEIKLLEEIAMIQCVKEKMKRLIVKVEAQLQANRTAQHQLEMDLTNKKVAQEIDRKCFNLRNTSEDISYFLGVENVDATVSIPETWGKFSDKNILHSQCQRAASSKLREEIENLMEISSREMWSKFNEVNVAFTKRISEIAETKNRIKVHLAKNILETSGWIQ